MVHALSLMRTITAPSPFPASPSRSRPCGGGVRLVRQWLGTSASVAGALRLRRGPGHRAPAALRLTRGAPAADGEVR
jgi:hypothetical protein